MALQYWQQMAQVYPQSKHRTTSKVFTVVKWVGLFFYDHWAALIMGLLGLVILAAFSVPFLAYFGLDRLSKQIFFAMHLLCGQIPSHSPYICGHQCGLCVRCTAIYSTLFVTSAIFVFTKKRLPGIPWWLLVLLALPMAWDGTTQLFGLRESTALLRVITGALFGLGCAWFTFPLVHKTMLESQAPLVERNV
ncbi:MAG TPA: DUF2085 domain-containing protein [Ktedonobacteraceae bacterium]|nr:DUF2085 domain-containing protein [Ktedonobacteraceae bacterium]